VSEPPQSIGAYVGNQREQPVFYRPGRTTGIIAIVLIAANTIAVMLNVAQLWQAVSLLDGYLNGTGPTYNDVTASLATVSGETALALAVFLAAGIAFLLWITRVRGNAELLAGPESQRRSRGWAVGGWICPVVNLWFPYQIMTDIYRASARRPVDGSIIGFWWAALVTNNVLGNAVARVISSGPPTLGEVRAEAVLATATTILQIVAALLIAMIIERVNTWQAAAVPDDQPSSRW